jgi:hypothetical protein
MNNNPVGTLREGRPNLINHPLFLDSRTSKISSVIFGQQGMVRGVVGNFSAQDL